jgi:hypothetical protein
MGIPLESGAVPAAVSLINFLSIFCHCFVNGKADKISKPEDLPDALKYYNAFGIKS